MITQLRVRLTAGVLWVARLLAPRPLRQVVDKMPLMAFGMLDEIAKGRTGGVGTIRWWIDEDGEWLSQHLENNALEVMRDIRADWEGIDPPHGN